MYNGYCSVATAETGDDGRIDDGRFGQTGQLPGVNPVMLSSNGIVPKWVPCAWLIWLQCFRWQEVTNLFVHSG